MERSSEPAVLASRRAPLLLAGGAALVVVLTALAWSLLTAPASEPDTPATPDATPLWSLGLALLGLACGAAWLAASSLTRWRFAAQLREARAETQALSQMLDAWQWRSDAQHRILSLQPPPGAPGRAWANVPPIGRAVWEHFEVGDTDNLHQRLQSQALLLGLSAVTSDGCGWRLWAVPRFDAEGRFAGYLGTAREVVAELAAPDPAALAAPPSAADTSADAEAFSYTVSHDLRAPLRVVEGFTRILKEDYGHALDRIGNDHLDRVLGAAARMNCMIEALLALARLSSQPLARQPVNLSQLAQFVIDDLRRANPDRPPQVFIEPGLGVTGDPTLLRIALENLLGNAWKYSSRAEAPRIRFERCNHDGREAFVVRDNGAGFDMRFAERLFGMFQRLHSANDYPGTGVGLASVKRIVQRHGGDIWAESEVGQGASFYFTLN